MRNLTGLITWLRARRTGWSGESDRVFHDTLFAAHTHDPFSPAYTGNITIRRFADLAAPFIEPRGLVVDVGCGLGEITCELARRYPEARFLGVDHSRAGIAGARRNAERLELSNISFEVHDMETYTPGADVDLVTMFDAFHHLLEPQAFIDRMGRHTRRFLLIEPQGDWKGSWVRDLDFDWLARDLEKIRARLAYAVAERRHPGASNGAFAEGTRSSAGGHGNSPGHAPGSSRSDDSTTDTGAPTHAPGGGEPVENRYSVENFEKMFRGYGLRIRGTVSGLDEYPPEPTLDTPTRREFGELAYRLYRSADELLYEGGLDLHAKHLVIYAAAGAESERRPPPADLPPAALQKDRIRGAHDVAYLSYEGPERGSAGATFRATLRLQNRSFRLWSSAAAENPDFVSYHWLDEQRQVVVQDGIRNPLPRGLPAGEEIEVALRVEAPGRPGSYVLALDLVQEGRTWFSDAGSPTLDIPFEVEAGRR